MWKIIFSGCDSMDVGRSGEVQGVVGRVWEAEIIWLFDDYATCSEQKKRNIRDMIHKRMWAWSAHTYGAKDVKRGNKRSKSPAHESNVLFYVKTLQTQPRLDSCETQIPIRKEMPTSLWKNINQIDVDFIFLPQSKPTIIAIILKFGKHYKNRSASDWIHVTALVGCKNE